MEYDAKQDIDYHLCIYIMNYEEHIMPYSRHRDKMSHLARRT